MINKSTILDNSTDDLMMANALRDLISREACHQIKIATGYWDLKGMAIILPQLQEFLARPHTSLQLLIGSDPVVRADLLKRPIRKGAHFPQDFIRRDLQELELRDDYVATAQLLRDYCLTDEANSRFQIRLYAHDPEGDAQFLHAKCYIMLGDDFSAGIIGSSNFTLKGLEDNAELNILALDEAIVTAEPNPHHRVKGHDYWFQEKWEQAQPWNQIFLEQILRDTPVERQAAKPHPVAPLTPYELYIKLLGYKFGDIIDLDQQQLIESYLPKGFRALDYQIQAVKQCFAIMQEHGGFMLADVVGLGKTVVGTLIIKHFLRMPSDDGRERQVLIVTPPAIKAGWQNTVSRFDSDDPEHRIAPYIDYVTTGSITNLLDTGLESGDEDGDEGDTGDLVDELVHKNYGLILIDESHKFRNSSTLMYHALDDLISEVGASTGVTPYIGLLSATPQNNQPTDLRNQIYLFERNHADSTLKKAQGGNLEGFFADIERRYKQLIAAPRDPEGKPIPLTPEERAARRTSLVALSHEVRSSVLEDILVRRTRTDIAKYYPGSGLTFPTIVGPCSLEYEMDDELARLFADTMTLIAPTRDDKDAGKDCLSYYRYRAIEYFKEKGNTDKYKGRGNRTPENVADQLARIMQIMLVKRLESSFVAFTQSLLNLKRYTANFIKMWENDTLFICPQIDINQELDTETKSAKRGHRVTFDECVSDIRAKIQQLNKQGRNERGQNAEYSRDDFKPEYIKSLKSDYELIDQLCVRWAANSADPKFDKFKECLKPVLFNPETNTEHKLVIFSEAVDTVNALKRVVKQQGLRPLVITAANRQDMQDTIAANFDANYPDKQLNDYDVIITTEVLAEGVNLHRANCILNYDTPWNSTRLMQRIGRVNRIGSRSRAVYVYNFMPSAQGDAEIQLVQKAYTKLQSFHTLFGEDSQVFTADEEVMHYDLNKVVNGDESPAERYIAELKAYKQAHPARYAEIMACEDNLQQALPTHEGRSYFLIRNDRIASLFVCVEPDADGCLKARMLSGTEIYGAFKPESEDTAQGQLPDDWAERKKQAEQAANRSLTRLNIHHGKGQAATKAKGIITYMRNTLPLSKNSLTLLGNAFQLVNKGNADVIRRIIDIGKELEASNDNLFPITQEEIDDLLNREIANIARNISRRYGEAHTYMAISR